MTVYTVYTIRDINVRPQGTSTRLCTYKYVHTLLFCLFYFALFMSLYVYFIYSCGQEFAHVAVDNMLVACIYYFDFFFFYVYYTLNTICKTDCL